MAILFDSVQSNLSIEVRVTQADIIRSIHCFNLHLQFVRVVPVVVALTIGNILTATCGQTARCVCVHANVLFARKKPNDFGIASLVIEYYGARIVWGAVLANNQFKWEIATLGDNAFDCLSDEFLMFIGEHYDAHQRLG
jgi:hypothetical protein